MIMLHHTQLHKPNSENLLDNIEHSPYSPDLSPRDYMFQPLIEELGNYFNNSTSAINTTIYNFKKGNLKITNLVRKSINKK